MIGYHLIQIGGYQYNIMIQSDVFLKSNPLTDSQTCPTLNAWLSLSSVLTVIIFSRTITFCSYLCGYMTNIMYDFSSTTNK